MTAVPAAVGDRHTDALVAGVADAGYAVAPSFLDAGVIAALRARVAELVADGALVPAAVGRGDGRALRADIRGDRIAWVDFDAPTRAERVVADALEALRVAFNRTLQLGLFEHEAHYARYAPGAGYARHVDRFRGDDARVLSFVLYLNAGWRAGDGGELRLETRAHGTVDVAPVGGTLVAFLADGTPHEVRPARRERVSLAGWLRRRAPPPRGRRPAQC